MDPKIRIGAVVLGIILIAASRLLGMVARMRRPEGSEGYTEPSWLGTYMLIAFGGTLIVGGIVVDGAWAVVTFVVILWGLSLRKIILNIRAGGYGSEE